MHNAHVSRYHLYRMFRTIRAYRILVDKGYLITEDLGA